MTASKMPVLFVGHGGPTFALENNRFTEIWDHLAQTLPRPKAILSIAAHWETRGTAVTAMERPRTIHDFYGFGPELFQLEYPAPGDPELAREIQQRVKLTPIQLDQGEWGLDHGTWVPLSRIYPQADIPVLQLSLDHARDGAWHYQLGKELAFLREQGVLIMANGGIVHNLRTANLRQAESGYDWAETFDQQVKELILKGEHEPLQNYLSLGSAARMSVPTPEHYYPLLYALALQEPGEPVSFPLEGLAFGSVSMRTVRIG